MKRTLLSLILIFAAAVSGRAERVNTPATDFTIYRQIGEIKAWSFVARDSALGQLFSTVKRKTKFAGEEAYEIDQNLQLDYTKIGTNRNQSFSGNHYVSEQGYYLGDELEITTTEERGKKDQEKLELKRDGATIKGYYTRAGNDIDREIEFKKNGFAADLMYLDMFENFFAHHEFTVGDTIIDTIFVPQAMLIQQLKAVVESFGYVSLYNQVRDSAFVIRIVQPQPMVVYFNTKRQLVKADYLARQMKAYLDIIRTLPKEMLTKPQFTFSKFTGLIPLYSVYLLLGVISLLFFAGANSYRLNLYIFIIVGGLSFIVAAFTQVPLQNYFAQTVYAQHVNDGGSPFFWAAVTALPSGLIQELLKLVVIVLATKYLNSEKNKLLYYGAAIGAGFGIVEAAFIVSKFSTMEVWSMNLVERGFQILFHTASGVVLAAAVQTRDTMKRTFNVVLVILVNTWIRYIPVFAQGNVIKPELLYLLQPIAPLILIVYCISIFKKQKSRA